MRDKLRNQVLSILHEMNPYEEIDENTNLIEEGILDSLTLVILVNELEHAYCIKVPEKDLKPEIFESVAHIVSLMSELLGS